MTPEEQTTWLGIVRVAQRQSDRWDSGDWSAAMPPGNVVDAKAMVAAAAELDKLQKLEQAALNLGQYLEEESLTAKFRRVAVLLKVDEILAELERLRGIELAAQQYREAVASYFDGPTEDWGWTREEAEQRRLAAESVLWAALDGKP